MSTSTTVSDEVKQDLQALLREWTEKMIERPPSSALLGWMISYWSY
jgi:hypothetical protein